MEARFVTNILKNVQVWNKTPSLEQASPISYRLVLEAAARKENEGITHYFWTHLFRACQSLFLMEISS